jgi:threonylcarbamoyladenosine tRNA methylthiotransferase MtaB
MFENSLRIVDDCGLTYLHVFPFSPRPGTPAARMPQLEKQHGQGARAAACAKRASSGSKAFLASEVGACMQVLVETPKHGPHAEHFAQVKFGQPDDRPAPSCAPWSRAANDDALQVVLAQGAAA